MENNQTEKGFSEMAASLDAGLCGEGVIFPARAKEDNESLLLWHLEALVCGVGLLQGKQEEITVSPEERKLTQ